MRLALLCTAKQHRCQWVRMMAPPWRPPITLQTKSAQPPSQQPQQLYRSRLRSQPSSTWAGRRLCTRTPLAYKKVFPTSPPALLPPRKTFRLRSQIWPRTVPCGKVLTWEEKLCCLSAPWCPKTWANLCLYKTWSDRQRNWTCSFRAVSRVAPEAAKIFTPSGENPNCL